VDFQKYVGVVEEGHVFENLFGRERDGSGL
jgi:hypothetical protein